MYDRLLGAANEVIVDHPRRVIIAFLVVTALFAVGLGNISTSAGTQAFSEDVPAERAFQNVQDDFGPSFSADTGSTQLIQSGSNVLGKTELLRMLEAQQRLQEHEGLRVSSTASAASIVATTLDPGATTLAAQKRAIESATPSEIDAAVRAANDRSPQFAGLLSKDFNPESASASATIGVVTHRLPAGISSGSGQGGSSPLTAIQLRAQWIVDGVGGDIRVFGSGIISAEFSNVIVDSMIIVVPAAVLFIILFLVVAYRDLADLLLGMLALVMAIVWTFGFMGLAGIPFSQMLIAVPPLLLAVGIDFGIHAVNRYREETAEGAGVDEAMTITARQLLVAFFIVTGTTVIGFASNLTSSLPPIQDFGIVASIGIVFTFLIFGVFLPAAKVELDHLRARYPIPTFSRTPLGSEGGVLARVLTGGVFIAKRTPKAFLVVMLLSSVLMAGYATGVDTSFSNEDFLPPEEVPQYLQDLPEPFAPSEYTVTRDLNFLEAKFASTQDGTVTIYVRGPMRQDHALEAIYRAGDDVPDSFITEDGRGDATSIVTVIQDRAARDPEFAALVAENDLNDNGVPDDNLEEIYAYLLNSSSRSQTLSYLTEDYSATRVVYAVEASASQSEITSDAQAHAEEYRYPATATGSTVVFQAISDLIFNSAIVSLAVALAGTSVFLVVIYRVLEGKGTLGVANLVPIVITVAFVAGTMRVADIAFNAFTATVLAITIGLGIDYSVHVVHRFADEYRERKWEFGTEGVVTEQGLFDALDRTVRGTGGALAGSMLTTVFGIGVLVLSVFPAIGSFGSLTALSVVYSFVASLLVLPSALVVWARFVDTVRGTPVSQQ
ncbi:efflux RND transporter permease subunit [Natronomonas sp. EA1]|uniref:efflux RND transporter permease subunit n=1 Tax=Natronomonas sp. EA1 TaxID=3421655 RepID=UPI003EBBC730